MNTAAENNLALACESELYALNLFSASTPNALPRPSEWELERFSFFVTQTHESGRVRFHLHMGFFENKEQATEQLGIVRATYPWAWVSLLPLELAEGRVAPLKTLGVPHPLFSRSNDKSSAAAQPKENSEANFIEKVDTDAADALETTAERPLLKKLHVGRVIAIKKGEGSNLSLETARYAVQLLWSVQPMSLDRVQGIELFDEYILYVAQCEVEGRKWYALRLGFFSRSQSAMAIAKYLRSEFYSAALIPVTREEKLQVSQLVSTLPTTEMAPDAVSLLLSNA